MLSMLQHAEHAKARAAHRGASRRIAGSSTVPRVVCSFFPPPELAELEGAAAGFVVVIFTLSVMHHGLAHEFAPRPYL